MAIQIKPDQAFAYAELLEILSLMEEEYVKRVPQKLIDIFEENALSSYKKHLDVNKPLEEQEVSSETTALIAMLTLNYWCESEDEKRKLTRIYKENEQKYQKQVREKYNPDNIFNNKNTTKNDIVIESEISTESEQIVENFDNLSTNLPLNYQVFPWYKKVFTKVRNFVLRILKKV